LAGSIRQQLLEIERHVARRAALVERELLGYPLAHARMLGLVGLEHRGLEREQADRRDSLHGRSPRAAEEQRDLAEDIPPRR